MGRAVLSYPGGLQSMQSLDFSVERMNLQIIPTLGILII